MNIHCHRIATDRLRSVRRLAGACVVIAYVLAGLLHGVCDLDVTSSAGGSEMASVLGGKAGTADAAAPVEHHCHGCFSVVLPRPVAEAAASGPAAPLIPHRPLLMAGVTPDPVSPPPKHLV